MRNTSPPSRARRLGILLAAAALAIFGVAVIAQALDGRSTVHSALQQEAVVGLPYMTPTAIAVKAKDAGLPDLALPECSVAGKPVDDGSAARCFAQYMRIDALVASHGATYAQMPRFAAKDGGKATNDPALAQRRPDGRPVDNPARNVWVTATALSTALNTSYMGEQLSLFAIAIGVAFLLVGLVVAGLGTAGTWFPAFASTRRRAAEGAMS
jgi:protein-S-isoprenylcysteine O-methyltransferase Ste14